tara:strand:- start:8395 stop:9717 length:1323 start_codon:yes stop_codon:yes gene_type:complete
MISVNLLVGNLSASLIFKALAIVVGIITIPAYIEYFDDQTILGNWFTLLALLNWLLFFDLGLGNGLKNELILTIAEKKYGKARKLILQSYLLLFLISFIIIAVAYIVYLITPNFLLGYQESVGAIPDISLIILVTFIIIFLQFPLRLVISILLAMQKSAIANFLPLVTQALVLCYLLFSDGVVDDVKFLNLSIVYGVAVCAPLILATIYVYILISRWNYELTGNSTIKDVFKLIISGSKFFWIQVCLLALNGSNEFLILNINAPEDVVQYQIYFRVFSIFLIVFSTITVPLWSAIGQAKAQKNINRILKIDRAMRYILLAALFGMLLLSFILPYIFNFWLGEGVIKHEFYISLIFLLYVFVMMGINYSACVANGYNKLNVQLKYLNIAVIIKFSTIYLFYDFITQWTDIVVITIISLLPALIFQYIFSRKILMAELHRTD